MVQNNAICGVDLDVCLIRLSKTTIYSCPIGLIFKSTKNKGLIGQIFTWTLPNQHLIYVNLDLLPVGPLWLVDLDGPRNSTWHVEPSSCICNVAMLGSRQEEPSFLNQQLKDWIIIDRPYNMEVYLQIVRTKSVTDVKFEREI